MMLSSSFAHGVRSIGRRKGLVLLLYGLDLALALVISLGVLVLINDEMASSGFARDLADSFDIVVWADLGERLGGLFGMLFKQAFWIVPLWLVWKAVSHAGLVHALRGDAVRPFWDGVGRYGGRSVLLAVLYLLALVAAIIVVAVVALGLNAVWGGEVGVFWTNLVIVPTLAITLMAVLDLMHDYSRIALVVDEQKVTTAFSTGLGWPLRHGQASWLYLAWFIPAAALWFLPFVLDVSFVGGTAWGVWGLFLLQQVVLLVRAAVTVGWIGSETALYETVRLREAPLIAEDEAASATYEPPDAEANSDWAVA